MLLYIISSPNTHSIFSSPFSQYDHGIFRSNAQKLVNEVPPIEVHGNLAVCDGGSGALGHPVEYIMLDKVSNKPAVCKYCGLRYVMAAHH